MKLRVTFRFSGQVRMILLIRKLSGAGLVEAKNFVQNYAKEIAQIADGAYRKEISIKLTLNQLQKVCDWLSQEQERKWEISIHSIESVKSPSILHDDFTEFDQSCRE